MIQAYASRTGTIEFLIPLAAAGWGLLVCASKRGSSEHRAEGFDRIASDLEGRGRVMLDNGAWKVREADDPAEAWRRDYEGPFGDLVDTFGARARLIVCPDIVGGGRRSLDLSLAWADELASVAPILIPAQDGLEPADLADHVGPGRGIAVGGSTSWKWSTLSRWAELGRSTGAHVHVLRANSARMVRRIRELGCHSFDGTGPTTFGPDCLRRVDAGRHGGVQLEATALGLETTFGGRRP